MEKVLSQGEENRLKILNNNKNKLELEIAILMEKIQPMENKLQEIKAEINYIKNTQGELPTHGKADRLGF